MTNNQGGHTMEPRRPRSRRDLLRTMGLTAAGGVALSQGLPGLGSRASAGQRRAGAGDFPETPEWNFVFVNHVTTNPFFVPTQYGSEDASALLNPRH